MGIITVRVGFGSGFILYAWNDNSNKYWNSNKDSFYMHEMTIPISIRIPIRIHFICMKWQFQKVSNVVINNFIVLQREDRLIQSYIKISRCSCLTDHNHRRLHTWRDKEILSCEYSWQSYKIVWYVDVNISLNSRQSKLQENKLIIATLIHWAFIILKGRGRAGGGGGVNKLSLAKSDDPKFFLLNPQTREYLG